MVLGPVYVVAFTVLAGFCWHLVYRWFLNEGASNYESLMLTSVFQSMFCAACFIIDTSELSIVTDIRENNLLEEFYMIVAAGFFFHDTPHWQPRYSLTSYTLLFHHVIAFVFLLATLFFGKGGSIALEISFFMEVTTPLLAIRHYMRMAKINCISVELLYAVLFVALRFWVGADIMLTVYQKDEVPLPFKVGVLAIYFMSCGLLPGVLHMILNPEQRKKNKQPGNQSSLLRNNFLTTLFRNGDEVSVGSVTNRSRKS